MPMTSVKLPLVSAAPEARTCLLCTKAQRSLQHNCQGPLSPAAGGHHRDGTGGEPGGLNSQPAAPARSATRRCPASSLPHLAGA